jgi:hypothetical protein
VVEFCPRPCLRRLLGVAPDSPAQR